MKKDDKVQLKSGGAVMTIRAIHGDFALCSWDEDKAEWYLMVCLSLI